MKILFIGIGSIGQRHCINLQKILPNVELVFYKKNNDVDLFAEKIGAQIVHSIDQGLHEADAVFLCSPSHFRMEAYEKILQSNLPLYVEKPLASNMNDLNILDSMLESYSGFSQVGFNLRYLPVVNIVKDIILSQKLGNICRALFEVGQYLPDWRKDKDYRTSYSAQSKAGGGVVLDLIHEVDLAYYFFGDFVEALIASNKFSCLEIDTADTAALILKRKTSPIVTVNMDYVARKKIRHFRIIGDIATLFCDLINKKLVIEGDDFLEEVQLSDNHYDFNESYVQSLDNFMKNNSSSCSIKDSIKMHQLILSNM